MSEHRRSDQDHLEHWVDRRRASGDRRRAPVVPTSASVRVTRVLICGDQPLFRSAVCSLIERDGRFHITAESTTQLPDVQPALSDDVQMVLIDFDLQSESPDALHSLERLLDAAAPRMTLIISAGFDSDASQAVLKHGISGIVLKRSGGDALLSAMRSALRGQVWLDRAVLSQMFGDSQSKAARGEHSKIDLLTPREREIVQVICTGMSNKQIAHKLSISQATVRHHLGSIFAKLGVSTRSELVVYSYRNKLADPTAEPLPN